VRHALAFAALWVALAGATPLPLIPPPPDLAPLVGFVSAPLDKPPVLAEAPLPSPPLDLPVLPPAAIVVPAADKPAAFVQPPRALPCIGAWTGVASESLECGRARFQRGEYEDAAKALESATKPGVDPDILREARYWLGETYYRLGRIEQADWAFRQVVQDRQRDEWRPWGLHSSGWTALRVGDITRARDAFTTVLGAAAPAPVEPWARYGLGLAQYAAGQYAEAVKTWDQLLERGTPTPLARDVLFWHGDALGRVNEPGRAEADLKRFVDGGSHPLLTTARLRLGWWALAAGHTPEALGAFRAYAPPAGSPERDWGEAGLALALLEHGDWKAARDTAAALANRNSKLTVPLLVRLIKAAAAAPQKAEIDPIVADALAAPNLAPAVRAWVLIAKGEVDRAQGNRDEARTQFDLARQTAAGTPAEAQAAFRLARVNFELREFQQALGDLASLPTTSLPPELRAAILHLQGEASYQAGDYAAASAAFRRALVEFPASPEAPMVRLAVAWSSLRQGRTDAARREFLEFVRVTPENANAVDALEIAAELALTGGHWEQARELLDRIVQTYPTQPRADFARINRAILLVRSGEAGGGKTALTDWLGRAPFPALFGRAHAALAVALLDTGDVTGAQKELALAQKEGLGAFASAGAGVIALDQKRWDDAIKRFEEARDAGTPDVVAAADYGIAAANFARGKTADFKKPATAALAAVPPGPRGAARAGALLYVLTGIAVEDKDWAGALASARRLVNEQPAHEAADDALERVAAGAAQALAWPVATQADTLLRQKYPDSPFAAGARLRLAEGLVETGKTSEARSEVEKIVADSPNDPRAVLLLARVREAAGDRAGALEAYSRAARDSKGAQWSTAALMGHARLLVQEQRWDQARSILERLLKSDETAVAAEAAQAIGDTYAGEGDQLAAAEYYLTASYVAPTSPAGRRALLGAARAFAALKQPEQAVTACKKLLTQSDLPSDLAAAARSGPCAGVTAAR
jgi:tetratricopeptide (TPR) repeat protein